MSYIGTVFRSIDQLGNALAGGNSDTTISGRIGFFANHDYTITRWYWIILEKIVDFTFWPLDGPNHCHDSYHADENEDYHDVNGVAIFILSLIILATCPIIMLLLYPLWGLKIINNKEKENDKVHKH